MARRSSPGELKGYCRHITIPDSKAWALQGNQASRTSKARQRASMARRRPLAEKEGSRASHVRAHLCMHLCTTPKNVCLYEEATQRLSGKDISGHIFRLFHYFDSHTHPFTTICSILCGPPLILHFSHTCIRSAGSFTTLHSFKSSIHIPFAFKFTIPPSPPHVPPSSSSLFLFLLFLVSFQPAEARNS